MTVYVFTGPSLTAAEGRTRLDAVFLPPVAQGDVYRAALRKPLAIGIIDGLFESVPAVWHKEILWAMAQGIHVFGAASMGALRAAELEAFGMVGVGRIFEAFRSGVLEDDDEVTIAHAPAELDYRELSDAMVNIRATLDAAEAAAVIRPDVRTQIEAIAKSLYYPERSYPRVLERAAAAGVDAEKLAALRAWLPSGRVNQKREDALAMLDEMRARLDAGLQPKQVAWMFEHTDVWDEAICQAGEMPLEHAVAHEQHAETLAIERLLDELRLSGEGYFRTYERTLARLLAVGEARRSGVVVTPEHLQHVTDAYRRERGLLDVQDVARWLDDNHVNLPQFGAMLADEARRRWIVEMTKSEVASLLPEQLRLDGEYARLLARAQAKQQALAQRGLLVPALADLELDEAELYRWYFETRLARALPDDVTAYAHEVGFASEDAFRAAVLAECCFARLDDTAAK